MEKTFKRGFQVGFLLVLSLFTRAYTCPDADTFLPCTCRENNEQLEVTCSESHSVIFDRISLLQNQNMTIRSITIQRCDIVSIPEKAFEGLSISQMYVQDNSLETLFSQSFNGIEELTYLNLEGNRISSLPAQLFRELSNLTWLHLGHNQISELATGSLDGLLNVEFLYMLANNITSLPNGIFDHLVAVTYFQLADNAGIELKEDIFSTMEKLRFLYLYNSGIKNLPIGVFRGLISLHSLYLQNNLITELTPNNSSEGLFEGMTNLEILKLNDNKISGSLPKNALKGLKNLKTLELQNNNIATLELQSFIDAEKALEHLELQNNELKDDSVAALSNAKDLTYIDLSSNSLKIVKQGAFANMHYLRTLKLQNNEIEFVCPNAVSRDAQLFTLQLDNNNLQFLVKNVFSYGDTFPVILSLSGNELHCDCSLDWVTQTSDIHTLNGACATPNDVAGLFLFELEPGQLNCDKGVIVPWDIRCDVESADVSLKLNSLFRQAAEVSWVIGDGVTSTGFLATYISAATPSTEETITVDAILGRNTKKHNFEDLEPDTDYRLCIFMETSPYTYDNPKCIEVRTSSEKQFTRTVFAASIASAVVGTILLCLLVFCLYVKMCQKSKNDSIADATYDNPMTDERM